MIKFSLRRGFGLEAAPASRTTVSLRVGRQFQPPAPLAVLALLEFRACAAQRLAVGAAAGTPSIGRADSHQITTSSSTCGCRMWPLP
ncbi:hypothetical protein [Kibdelosporangium philippinense]|uniref:hypothetical protein n=1 Tax=Kibdelosporangium philippinense TaxID=211113 RepID=UPI0036118C49